MIGFPIARSIIRTAGVGIGFAAAGISAVIAISQHRKFSKRLSNFEKINTEFTKQMEQAGKMMFSTADKLFS